MSITKELVPHSSQSHYTNTNKNTKIESINMKSNTHNGGNIIAIGGILFVLLASVGHFEPVTGAPRIVRRSADYHQQQISQSSSQTVPELDLVESIKQHQAAAADGGGGGGLSRNQFINGADVASLTSQSQQRQLVRQRRSASVVPQQLAQQIYGDERSIKSSQLPEMIAQARNDRELERALLRVLISNLRTNLAETPLQQVGDISAANYNAGWQDINSAGDGNSFEARGLASRLMVDGGSIDQMIDQAPAPLSAYQSSLVDKREYIKPCSFNAVSCAKNPFRKLL